VFNFSDFCKNVKCPNYKERKHSAGTWRYCELIGTAFYVTERPENCPHLKEIDAIALYEKEKDESWKKLTTKSKPKPKDMNDEHPPQT